MSDTATTPAGKAHVFIMPQKFLDLKKLVEENGTESQKQLVQLAGDYLAGLNNMFYDRPVNEFMLKEFDFPMFVRELEHAGLLDGISRRDYIFLLMNVKHIVRHTWELTGKNGEKKTGDDLRKAWPLMWEHDAIFTLEQLFRDVQTM